MRHKSKFEKFRIAEFSFAVLLIALTFDSFRLLGQSPPGGTIASPTQPHLSQIPERLLRQFGGLIQLDIVVTDTAGHPVSGLKPGDFTVLENGKPRDILSFVGHGIASKPNPPVETIIVIDMGNMRPEAGSQAKDDIVRFLQRNQGHLDNPVSVFAINALGMIDTIGPSTDGNTLAANFALSRTPSISCRVSDSSKRFVSNGRVTDVPSEELNAAHEIQPNLLSLMCLGRIATLERQKPGRKLLIWVGPQYGPSSGVDPVNWNNPDPQSAFNTVVWFSTLFREARITLFSTWVVTGNDNASLSRSLGESGSSEAGLNAALTNRASLTGSSTEAFQPVRLPRDVRPTDLTRDVLAFKSGGGVPEPDTDLVKVIDNCAKSANTFYSISFDPSAATHLDEYHDVKVQMKDPGLIARTNPGFYDEPFYTNEQRPANQRVAVQELQALLEANSGESDAELAQRITGLELTERLEGARLSSMLASIRGRKARNALIALSDLASFLPAASLANAKDLPPPTPDEQEHILIQAQEYLKSTITRFPDFIATRRSARYQEITKIDRSSTKIEFEPMHLLDDSEEQVIYRQGREIVDAEAGKRSKRSSHDSELTTYGVFGPSLQIMREIVSDSSLVTWSHWEQDSNGRRAVFTYSIPSSRSLYQVKACCLPDGDGRGDIEVLPGHHGEIAIDTATGAIFRLSALADLKGFLPILKSDLMIAFGPVNVGGETYICPVKSVTVFAGRSTWERAEWGWAYFTYGPSETKLNDFEFTNYHIFRSSSRVLPGDQSSPE